MKLRLLLILILILTIPNSGIFTQTKKQTVAVLEFNSNSRQIGRDELATLTSRFRTMLVKTEAFDVLERQKMSDILKEQNFTLSDNCNSAECAVQVGQLLGVELMIAGDVGKLGDTYSVDLRLISVTTGKIIQTESQDHEGKIDGLFGTLAVIANSFAGIKSNASSDSKPNRLISSSGAEDNMFIDPRDGKKYKTVKIGNQIWMAENLNYETSFGSWCYDGISSNCYQYGRLYNWNTAQIAVPPGWHIPSRSEWEMLLSSMGDSRTAVFYQMIVGGASGFSAVLGGWRDRKSRYAENGVSESFWSSSEIDAISAWKCGMYSSVPIVAMYNGNKDFGYSVRCIKD